jgi:nitroreductase
MKSYPHNYRFVDDAITSRRSVRAFLPKPVAREVVADILDVARRAPSGTNIQPWFVHVLSGASRDELSRRILAAFNDPAQQDQHKDEYAYYPSEWVLPYIDRRRKVGFALYGLLGIGKGERQKMHEQTARNFKFFDAPVGLMFTIDRTMQQGSWLDYGMFVQNVMVAARARGLDTCPQVAFTPYHRIIGEFLGLPANQMLVCGMSLGHADPDAPENRLVTDRENVDAFATFSGFPDSI